MISYEILASFLIYCASIGYGGAIGAGLPELASSLNISESVCGQLFAFRGAGYLLGSLLASKLGHQRYIPSYGVVAFAIYISGIATALSALTNNFNFLKVILLLQGLGFSLIDVFGAVCLCETWGDRVQVFLSTSFLSLSPTILLSSHGFNCVVQHVPLVQLLVHYLLPI